MAMEQMHTEHKLCTWNFWYPPGIFPWLILNYNN